MKTLSEIIDETKDGGRPEYDDLRYALVAMCALHHFAFESLRKLAQQEREGKYKPALFGLDWHARERFNQFKAALNVPPKQYVGPQHDPDTEECQKFRKMANRLLTKVLEREQASNKGLYDSRADK